MAQGCPFPNNERQLLSSTVMQYSIKLLESSLDLVLISKDIKLS